MKERPILFSGAMVRAVLEGRKTKTRRVLKQACHGGVWADGTHPAQDGTPVLWWHLSDRRFSDATRAELSAHSPSGMTCPYGKAGDRLWGRETFYVNAAGEIIYRADFEPSSLAHASKGWKPSIFMPRTHSRLSLEIASIGVERVQEITEADAIAEGVDWAACSHSYTQTIGTFAALWDGINAKRGYGWDANPWVWVVEFKRHV